MLPEIVATVLGVISPFVIQFLKKKVESKQARYLIALVLSGVTGVVAALVLGEPFVFINIIKLIAVVFGASQVAYNSWKALLVKE